MIWQSAIRQRFEDQSGPGPSLSSTVVHNQPELSDMPRTAQFPSPAANLPTQERGGINIDDYSVDADEIWRLALCLSRHATAAARAMFPEKPPGFRRATVSLGHYAFNKSPAMKCRA